ncbi:MAG: phosphoserine phosphatase SerB [Alphaproteobacteria bacterium]|nr:phosphoserine phosphatase SerB [Alphaproteobacteria bacterium]
MLVPCPVTTYRPAMTLVLTLIAASSDSGLEEVAAGLTRRLDASPRWLSPGTAVDLLFDAIPAEIARVEAEQAIADKAIDHALQPVHGRRKKLLVGDMDSTFITVECIDVLAAHAGLGDAVAAITQRSIRGELDFGDSLRERVALLAGAPQELLERAWHDNVAMTPGGATLIVTMQHHGALTALVSGGFTWFTERVVDKLGFDRHHANELEIADGAMSGRLREPILDRDAKRTLLFEMMQELGLSSSETLAVGDGANDIAMLKAAGLGVGYHPVDAARRVADAAIDHADLSALLYLQGYVDEDFVTPT